jgi:dTDP-4-amino-4,6-dideoxygalactose transaminase
MNEIKIPFADPKADYLAQKVEIDAAIQAALSNGFYILGPEVKTFEENFAKFVGLSDCISVNSGTDALILALKALGVMPGDEVITVSQTAVATVAAIELAGATPVLADIDPQSYTLNPALLPGLINEKTKAIIPVHLYGHPADMPAIMAIARQHQIAVVEDCAQAHGAKINGRMVGSFGDMACFSFYPTKNLGAIGDGGAVLTHNSELAHKLRILREYGWEERYVSKIAGMNSRLDEVQAAILNIKLAELAAKNQRRREIAAIYQESLANSGLILPLAKPGIEHVYHLYVVQSSDREKLREGLKKEGIGSGIHYPLAVHQQAAYCKRLSGFNELPVTENLVPKILSLPMYPQLTDEQVQYVCKAILKLV